jgi:hypothetical protein
MVRPPRIGYRLATLLTWVLIAVLVSYYLQATAGKRMAAATAVGRWYGLLGLLLFFFLAYYGLRRVTYLGRMQSLEWWYRVHLLTGAVALAVLACHCGIAFRSPFLSALQIGFWGTVLTGAGGWLYQTCMTRWLVRNEPRPAMLVELNEERERLLKEIAAGGGDEASLRAELEDVDKLRAKHRLLRGWTTVHLLFTLFALQMALWHVWMVGSYPR